MTYSGWLRVCGENDAALATELQQRVERKIAAGKFLARDVEYIRDLKRPLLGASAAIDDEVLEKLRRCCQTWNLEIVPSHISSHRPVIGAIIVAVKKIALPILKILLKDTIRRQRDFNAAAIALLATIAERQGAASGAPLQGAHAAPKTPLQ